MAYATTMPVTARCRDCGHRGAMHQLAAPVGERHCVATHCTCPEISPAVPVAAPGRE